MYDDLLIQTFLSQTLSFEYPLERLVHSQIQGHGVLEYCLNVKVWLTGTIQLRITKLLAFWCFAKSL